MQKLALVMAVMILGMSPAHSCSIGADPGSLEIGGQVEMMPLFPMWYGDDGTLTARNTVSSAAAEGNQPVEPGGHSIGRTLLQIQLRVEDLEGIGIRTLRTGEGEKGKSEASERGLGPEESSLGNRPKREAARKAVDALKKGADATRGRGQRRGRVYQRAGAINGRN
jgi:hypothetical protein